MRCRRGLRWNGRIQCEPAPRGRAEYAVVTVIRYVNSNVKDSSNTCMELVHMNQKHHKYHKT